MVETNRNFDWGNLVLGILFILAALVSFGNPAASLASIASLIGLAAIVKGIFEIFLRSRIRQATGAKSTFLIVLGIIDVLLGLLIVTNIAASTIALPIFFAIWFIIDAVGNLMFASTARLVSNGYYWFKVVVNVIGLFVGVMLLMNLTTSALTLSFLIGFNLLSFGILHVVEAFSR